jgi:thioredoxin
MSIETLTAEEVDAKVLQARGPVILDFYQATCAPCRALEPRLAHVTQQYPDRTVYRVDIDRNMAVAERFHVQSLPTILVLHNGREVERLDGLITETQLRNAFEQSSRVRDSFADGD